MKGWLELIYPGDIPYFEQSDRQSISRSKDTRNRLALYGYS
jgi:hypothetical protein